MISKPTYRLPVAEDSAAFFIDVMKGYKQYLSVQEFKTMKGQALAGDVEGARRGLNRLLRKEANMRKPSPGEKELITPDEAISFYTLSIRKTRALMKEETNFIVKYYDGRSLIIRREFEKYLENHPELRRR